MRKKEEKKPAPAVHTTPAAPSKATVKTYLVKHAKYGEITVKGVNRYEAVIAAAKAWRVPWSQIARECEYIVLDEGGAEGKKP